MTVGQLIGVLSEIRNKNLIIDDNIDEIIALGNRCFFIDNKIEEVYDNPEAVKSLRNDFEKLVDEIRNYQGR